MRESWSRPRYDGAEEESPIGAKITTYTMLGVPYYKYSIIYSKNPIPIIWAPKEGVWLQERTCSSHCLPSNLNTCQYLGFLNGT